MRMWGLTGGIASGKSLVARFFEEEGIPVIDADQIARELSAEGGPASTAIQARFGTSDRRKLREQLFGPDADPQARKDLEAILHPLIQAESLRRARKMAEKSGHPDDYVLLYEAALLVETGRYRELEGLIVVSAPEELRQARLMERDRLAPELAAKMIAAQATEAQRRAAATVLIENAGTVEELREQVRQTCAQLWPKR
jgi:dephospho-CoA kinase